MEILMDLLKKIMNIPEAKNFEVTGKLEEDAYSHQADEQYKKWLKSEEGQKADDATKKKWKHDNEVRLRKEGGQDDKKIDAMMKARDNQDNLKAAADVKREADAKHSKATDDVKQSVKKQQQATIKRNDAQTEKDQADWVEDEQGSANAQVAVDKAQADVDSASEEVEANKKVAADMKAEKKRGEDLLHDTKKEHLSDLQKVKDEEKKKAEEEEAAKKAEREAKLADLKAKKKEQEVKPDEGNPDDPVDPPVESPNTDGASSSAVPNTPPEGASDLMAAINNLVDNAGKSSYTKVFFDNMNIIADILEKILGNK